MSVPVPRKCVDFFYSMFLNYRGASCSHDLCNVLKLKKKMFKISLFTACLEDIFQTKWKRIIVTLAPKVRSRNI